MNNLETKAKEIIAEVLEIKVEEVKSDISIVQELGAESLDLLDILFKLSKETGRKVTMQNIQADVRGGLEEDEFISEDGFITEQGIEKIRIAFDNPSITIDKATSKDVLKLITINYILKFFSEE